MNYPPPPPQQQMQSPPPAYAQTAPVQHDERLAYGNDYQQYPSQPVPNSYHNANPTPQPHEAQKYENPPIPSAYGNPSPFLGQQSVPPEQSMLPPPQYQQPQTQSIDQNYGGIDEKMAMMKLSAMGMSQPGVQVHSYAQPPEIAGAGASPAFNQPQQPPKMGDEQKTSKTKRFLGDTLVGRFARASVATASSTLKMPASLSPWGDNNPVTLPNVRYRDAVLFTTFAFVGGDLVTGVSDAATGLLGADSFVAEIISSGAGVIVGSTIIKYGVFQIVEGLIDEGILEHLIPEEQKIIQTTSVKTMQCAIKHKLMGVDADIRLVGVYDAKNFFACEKGWFCPYLFASARRPIIPRKHDFAIAQCFGPFLGADYALAHKLLAETETCLALCDPDPTHDIGCNRLIVLFLGISPYRGGKDVWSSSRRPSEGLLLFHLLNGCPALVLPVNKQAPLLAWSPWTLLQMWSGQPYDAGLQHSELCEYLDTLVELGKCYDVVQSRYEDVLARCMSLVINGAMNTKYVNPEVLKKVDPERAGIVMFRY
ncbi:MAG: hypothetical protein M1824_000434 [Vezdaea acicularis]|nr:MAG: hypothetical protein M1824_000434 [Vezdaea acicularis]